MHLSKLKLLQSNKIIILAERFQQYIRVYYHDGHSEIVLEDIKTYVHQRKTRGYKNAILFDENWLYPTMNQRDEDCCWINLHYLKNANVFYRQLLKQKNLYQKAKMMYMKQIQKNMNTYDMKEN